MESAGFSSRNLPDDVWVTLYDPAQGEEGTCDTCGGTMTIDSVSAGNSTVYGSFDAITRVPTNVEVNYLSRVVGTFQAVAAGDPYDECVLQYTD